MSERFWAVREKREKRDTERAEEREREMSDVNLDAALEGPLPPFSDLMVLIVRNDVSESENPSETEVIDQAQAVADGLDKYGIPNTTLILRDPRAIGDLFASAPHGKAGTIIWNLFENTTGVWYSQTLLEASLPIGSEICGHGCVGADSLAMWLTTDKALTRDYLERAGLPVAPGVNFPMGCSEEAFVKAAQTKLVDASNKDVLAFDVLVKPTSSDGSEGIEWKKNIFHKGENIRNMYPRVKELHETMKMGVLAEKLVGDSELNISILEDPVLRVAAVADIDFSPLPEGYPRIVDFASKYIPEDPMYLSTRRLPSDLDEESLALVKKVALGAFKATGMRDFSRIDMRCVMKDRHIDPAEIWVLEVNANPCIAPDSGFHIGIETMGTPFHTFTRNMVLGAYKRSLDYVKWLKTQEQSK